MITQRLPNYGTNFDYLPKKPLDPSLRRLIYGPIKPMERRGFLARLLHLG